MSIWLSQIELDPRDRVMRAAVGDAHALHRLVVRAVSADTPAGVPARSNAATLDEVTVAEVPRVHGEREGKRIDFTPVTFAGVLAATDSAALRAIAVTGIGPRKAFGMGLLSIRKLPTTP